MPASKMPQPTPSERLARMLQAAAPKQREDSARIAAKLLAIRAKKAAENVDPSIGSDQE